MAESNPETKDKSSGDHGENLTKDTSVDRDQAARDLGSTAVGSTVEKK